MNLADKYRPRTFDDVVGQERAVTVLRSMVARGAGGHAVWLSGVSGCGKSTLAKILAGTIADEWMTTEVVGRDLSPSKVREAWANLQLSGMGKGGRALIVNEAHGLSGPTIEVLLDCLESIPDHVLIVFTTTKEGEAGLFADHDDASPLLSRCIRVPLTNQGLSKAFAERCLMIARGEGLDGQPIEAYVRLAQKHKNNFRAMLMDVESGVMLVK